VAVVGIDALFIRRPTVLEIRRMIQEKCGIAPEAVLIAASTRTRRSAGLLSSGRIRRRSPAGQVAGV